LRTRPWLASSTSLNSEESKPVCVPEWRETLYLYTRRGAAAAGVAIMDIG